jgi:hypothetical protein
MIDRDSIGDCSISSLTFQALTSTLPEHNWDVSKFKPSPVTHTNGHWSDVRNQRAFFDKLAEQLNIKQFEDWYKVSGLQVAKLGGKGLLKRYGYSLSKGI